jgi:tetratricopeptide (TPR) repeat protein
VKFRCVTWLVVCGGLALAGVTLRQIEAPVWAAVRAAQPALRLQAADVALGQGVTVGLLGGFRAIAADFVWLRMHLQWEKHDAPTTETLLKLVTALDPRPLYFWLNGARVLAYDMPAWRIASAGGYMAVTPAQQQRINLEQARLAVAYLDNAMKFHPTSAALWIERANIELTRLNDTAAAAESYRRACAQPGAPYYAARLHAELLRRLGRKTEALAWLRQIYPSLPKDDEAAAADLVLRRIRILEQELGVPLAQAYSAATP